MASKAKMTVEAAFKAWQGGASITSLRKQVGKCLRPAFRKLAGSPAEYAKVAKASRAARKPSAEKKGAKNA